MDVTIVVTMSEEKMIEIINAAADANVEAASHRQAFIAEKARREAIFEKIAASHVKELEAQKEAAYQDVMQQVEKAVARAFASRDLQRRPAAD